MNSEYGTNTELEMFYLNTIKQLFLFVEEVDQLEVCLPYSRLLTGIPILAVFQNLRWNSNKTSLYFWSRRLQSLDGLNMFFTLTINFRSYFYAFTYFSSCRRNQPPALKQPSWGLQYFRVKFSEKIVWSWSEHFFIHKLLENSRICRENITVRIIIVQRRHCAHVVEIHWKLQLGP